MTGLLIAFEIVLIVPLLAATWRTSLLGLSLQGALMAWIAFGHPHVSAHAVVDFVDLVVLRAVAGPFLLYRVLRQQNAPPRNDVIAPNLLSWGIALALILMAFRVADVLVPVEGEPQTVVAVSGSALLLAFLVLSTRSGPFSQMVGALRLENAVALFELAPGGRRGSLGVHVGQTLVFAGTILYFRWYLAHLPRDGSVAPGPERPVL